VGVDAASRITLEAGHQARPLDWHGQLISIQHPADIYDPGRNTCSGKFELQSNASLAVQKEVMRAKPAYATWQRRVWVWGLPLR
jgi:hypothetical protein